MQTSLQSTFQRLFCVWTSSSLRCQDNKMRTTLIILLAFCLAAITSANCPKSYLITKKDVKDSLFVALVEVQSREETQDSYVFKLKYDKLFQWWHYWVAESYIIYDAPKTLKIQRRCHMRLVPGRKYVLGRSGCKWRHQPKSCTGFSQCHFVKDYNSLTRAEKELVEKAQ
ncbi:hypothetical protein ANCCAN_24524 [Ancylostoma caninum]|uniref:Uncharacterized protein n=1 Tax=Ancylostoma caninum TaxID=29170 RepID=A0A368FFV8_ANCCA|nr:hypothetical protein ANCCAN_24524 [Ancylostoma caninum]